MEHKTKEIGLIKYDNGAISGYFSTYDREPDSYGDIVAPGAFTETIKAREESGHPYPLCWNHDLNQIIGFVDPKSITAKPFHIVKLLDNTVDIANSVAVRVLEGLRVNLIKNSIF